MPECVEVPLRLEEQRAPSSDEPTGMPEALSTRRFRRRMLELAGVGIVVATVILALPGLGEVRARLTHASPGWLVIALVLELLSLLSYVLLFRSVFCPRMRWRFAFQIGTSELAANSLLPASGAGGLALGAWALRRGGMDVEEIGRKTVAMYLLTSLANVSTMIAFVCLFAVGVLGRDPDPAITYAFGALAAVAVLVVLAVPAVLRRLPQRASAQGPGGRITWALGLARRSLQDGVPDAVMLLRRRRVGVLVGSFGTMAFNLAVLVACFRAVGVSPPIGIVVLGYLIGMLGGNLPLPAGIGAVDGGLIATLTLFGEPLAATTVAVLTYHAISLWVPSLIGSVAFVRLRATLQREKRPAAICLPLAEPLETVSLRAPSAELG